MSNPDVPLTAVQNYSPGRVHVPGYGFVQPGERADLDAQHPAVAQLLEFGTFAAPEAAPESQYASMPKEDLAELAEDRGLEVQGTGSGGNIVKNDLVAALDAADANTR